MLIYRSLHHIGIHPEMLEMCFSIPISKSPRTVFLGAVHALLMAGIDHKLSTFYLSLGGKFCKEDSEKLIENFENFFKLHLKKIPLF